MVSTQDYFRIAVKTGCFRVLAGCWVLVFRGWLFGGCLFLRYSEECHFLLIASMSFYTHSKTAVPRKEAGRVQGQAGEELGSRGLSSAL